MQTALDLRRGEGPSSYEPWSQPLPHPTQNPLRGFWIFYYLNLRTHWCTQVMSLSPCVLYQSSSRFCLLLLSLCRYCNFIFFLYELYGTKREKKKRKGKKKSEILSPAIRDMVLSVQLVKFWLTEPFVSIWGGRGTLGGCGMTELPLRRADVATGLGWWEWNPVDLFSWETYLKWISENQSWQHAQPGSKLRIRRESSASYAISSPITWLFLGPRYQITFCWIKINFNELSTVNSPQKKKKLGTVKGKCANLLLLFFFFLKRR